MTHNAAVCAATQRHDAAFSVPAERWSVDFAAATKPKMTKGKHPHKRSEGKVLNFDHLVFWVGNAKTASSYFFTRFGFVPLAVREATDNRPIQSYAVRLNQITIVFESPTSSNSEVTKDLTAHGDFVKDVAFEVQDLDELVRKAKEGGAEVVKGITEEKDKHGVVRYAVLKTYGDNTHTLIDRSKYKGVLLPGYEELPADVLSTTLPATNLMYIDHVEGNMADGTLEDSVAWYEKNLNMHRFWCVDYKHDLVPYSCINSASVINRDENVLDGNSGVVEGATSLSLLLVELVSPDVMYNGLPWPDEDFTKQVSIERELYMRGALESCAVARAALRRAAAARPALCLASALLRATAATLLHRLRAYLGQGTS